MKKTIYSFVLAAFIALSLAWAVPPNSHCMPSPSAESADAHATGGAHHEKKINWFKFGEETPPLIANFVNLAIMIFILWYFTRKPIGKYFLERSRKIRQAIEEAQKLKKVNEEKYRHISDKIERIEEETQTLKKELIAAAVAQNERVIAEARERSDQLRSNALRLIEFEQEAMIERLKREIAAQVLEHAEKMVKDRIRLADHDRITKETIEFYVEKS